MRAARTVVPVLAAALALSACGGSGEKDKQNAAPATRVTYEQACTAAKDEGPLDWWTQDPASAETTIKMFNEKYPDVEVKFTQLLENDIAQRLVAETNAKRPVTADLVVGHTAAFQPLVQRKLVATDVAWPQELAPGIVTETNMVRIHRRVNGLVYNTSKVTEADLPNNWEDLADPKWRGKVSVHATGIPFDVLSVAWGEEKTLEWARKMVKDVKPQAINGTTAAIQAAASGEVPIAASGRDSEFNEQKAAGAPIGIKYLNPVPTFDFFHAIPKGAEDVNAAVCFATWYSGEGATKVLPLSFSKNDDRPEGLPAGSEVIVVKPADVVGLSKAAQEVSEIWVNGG
jgi:iron(III) transport system substrate-binding protein